VTKKPDEDVLSIFKADAKRLGLGLREYCRQFGIEYESLGGLDRVDPLTKHEHIDYRTCDVCKMNSILNGRNTEAIDD
jgi:hypothetical protein